LIHMDNGKVSYNDQDISDWPMHKRAQVGVAYLPQEPSVFRKLSVEENILVVLETLPLSDSARKEELRRLLDEFNLTQVSKQKAFTLSGGERRRVEVARALAMKPHFILLDEPFAGIDPIAVSEIQKMIQRLKKKNIGILITDHNVRETLAICDFGYLLNDGKIVVTGTPEEIAANPIAREAYLGEDFQI
ncbi:MAG: LPS export ABC transporter ATP-binding protein, partial [Deltaproteobacteria bacterium]|nr:LPS export ABC transporter ATP-binding protein [Deltaproteobacteria bacterium]